MSAEGIAQIVLYVVVLIALAYPLGRYMAWVYTRKRDDAVERGFFRLLGRGSSEDQSWKRYALTVLVFSLAFSAVLYAILRLQGYLPVNPDHMKAVSSPLALNTAASFITNTNWQYYAGEATMSYLSQMAGLAVQNFVSAAVGMAVLAAVVRGLAQRSGSNLGNFWRDLYRSLVYILLPLSIIVAVVLIWQGVPQTFDGHATATTLQGAHADDRARPGRLADRDQAARHERRRVLQLELRRAVREPHRALELRRDARDPADPGGPGVHVRAHGRSPDGTPGWCSRRCSPSSRSVSRSTSRPSSTARRCCATRASTSRQAQPERRQHVPTRRSASASRTQPSGRWQRATPRTARSTPASMRRHGGRRRCAARQPLRRRGDLRRGRHRPVSACSSTSDRGLRRGPDGGPHARVVRQEDRSARDEVCGAGSPVRAHDGAHHDGGRDRDQAAGLASIFNTGVHGFTETLYAYTSQANNNGSAFAGYGLTTSQRRFRHSRHATSAASCRCSPASPSAGSLAQKKTVPASAGTFRTDGPTFVVLLVGVITLTAGLMILPALTSRPDRRSADALMRTIFVHSSPSSSITAIFGFAYPLLMTGFAAGFVLGQGARQPDLRRRQRRRLDACRPELHIADATSTSGPRRRHPPTTPPLRRSRTSDRPTRPSPRTSTQRPRRSSSSNGPYNPGLTIDDIPVDAVTTSGSGIDPEISPAYAQLQARRVAAVRHLPLAHRRAR